MTLPLNGRFLLERLPSLEMILFKNTKKFYAIDRVIEQTKLKKKLNMLKIQFHLVFDGYELK